MAAACPSAYTKSFPSVICLPQYAQLLGDRGCTNTSVRSEARFRCPSFPGYPGELDVGYKPESGPPPLEGTVTYGKILVDGGDASIWCFLKQDAPRGGVYSCTLGGPGVPSPTTKTCHAADPGLLGTKVVCPA